jgi:hypothetical protein
VHLPQISKLAELVEVEERGRVDTARNDIARRLRRVSSDLSENEFQELVDMVLRNHDVHTRL